MKDDPIYAELTDGEKTVFKVICKSTGINEKQIVIETKMNKNTVSKYVKNLLNYDLIEFVELKQGEKSYFRKFKFLKSFSELNKLQKEDFQIRKSLIRDCLRNLKGSTDKEKISVYKNCIQAIFSFHNMIKFLIFSNEQKKPMKKWLEYKKEAEEFLIEVSKGINTALVFATLKEMEELDHHTLLKLTNFIKAKEKKQLDFTDKKKLE